MMYTKQKDFSRLQSFYLGLSQLEILDYGEYEIGLQLLVEAKKVIQKQGQHQVDLPPEVSNLDQRIQAVQSFCDMKLNWTRDIRSKNPNLDPELRNNQGDIPYTEQDLTQISQFSQRCDNMINEETHNPQGFLNLGDVYGLQVECFQ